MFSPSSGVNFVFCIFLRKYCSPSSISLYLILKFCSRFYYPPPSEIQILFYHFPQVPELAAHVVQPLICVALERYESQSRLPRTPGLIKNKTKPNQKQNRRNCVKVNVKSFRWFSFLYTAHVLPCTSCKP